MLFGRPLPHVTPKTKGCANDEIKKKNYFIFSTTSRSELIYSTPASGAPLPFITPYDSFQSPFLDSPLQYTIPLSLLRSRNDDCPIKMCPCPGGAMQRRPGGPES